MDTEEAIIILSQRVTKLENEIKLLKNNNNKYFILVLLFIIVFLLYGLLPSVGIVVFAQALLRVFEYGFNKPSREIIYSQLKKGDRYKSTVFIDTFITRFGDLSGSIFMGIATPTEASGVGALGASILALIRGRLSLKDLKSVIRKTTHTTSYIFALFVGATMFALVLRGLGGDELIEGALKGLPYGPNGVVIVVLCIAFILGFFLDWIEITLILLPFLAPVMVDLGVDMVWFIVMFAVVLQTSFITPPVGFALFYMKGVAPQGITIQNIYRGIIPFVILQAIAVVIVFNFPQIVTWLPKIAYGP